MMARFVLSPQQSLVWQDTLFGMRANKLQTCTLRCSTVHRGLVRWLVMRWSSVESASCDAAAPAGRLIGSSLFP
jgi:hypothetical protein